ncbi:unnamed protein product [Closterium sp. NIES-54]
MVAGPCLCRLLSHQTLLWHHRLGHPSLPRLRGIHSRLLVSGLPRSLPPLSPSPASPCLPCDEGRQRAAPHSSSFPPTSAPLQTLHMDMWGPARVSGQGREHYFLLVVDNYTRYTTVFPLRNKGEVHDVLIPWICVVRLQLHERFRKDLPVLRLHSDRGVMEVARTSMIHAVAPNFLWPFAVRYAAHQLNLWPRVSLPETSPRLRWTWKVGDVSVFWVWGSLAFIRDTYADKLSSRAFPWVFLGFPPDAPGWQFYHPTSCHVLPSEDVTFDESVPFYRLFPYRTAPPPPPPPLFLAPGPPPVDPLPSQGSTYSGVSQVDPLPLAEPVEVTVDSGAAESGATLGAVSGDAEPTGAEPGGAEPASAEPGGAGGTGAGGAGAGGARARGAGVGGIGVRGAGAGDPGAGGAGAGGAGVRGTVQQRPFFVPLQPSPVRAASPVVTDLLATVVTGPSFDLVAESESGCPPSVGGECALCTDVLEDRQEDFECLATAVPHLVAMLLAPEGDADAPDIPTPRSYGEAITGPYSSQWHTDMDAEMASWKSTGTYVNEVPPRGANIGSLHKEIWLCRPPGFTGSFPAGTQWSLRRPVYGLRKAPREWHDTLRMTLAALGFAPSTADPSLFLRTDTSLPPFYILMYVDDLVFSTADTEALALVNLEL